MTTPACPEVCDLVTAQSFAQLHFGAVEVGHQSRNRAVLRLAENLCRHPGGTLPNKLACPADYQSMCRLVNRPEVTHERVQAPHRQRTRQRMEQTPGVVLLLHDTTETDYSGLDASAGLGPIGNGHGRGYLCHNTLAVALAGKEVLGLAHQMLHAREPVPAGEGLAAKRARASRESRWWSRAVTALGATPAEYTWIDVADRGADLFEFLATEQTLQRRCLVRACHNRASQVGHQGDGDRGLLFDHLRSLPAAGRRRAGGRRPSTRRMGRSRSARPSWPSPSPPSGCSRRTIGAVSMSTPRCRCGPSASGNRNRRPAAQPSSGSC